MTFAELQDQVREYLYLEDDGMTRIALASIIANRLRLGDPVWMLLIGPSSSGKSQILRPLALTDSKFIHRIDDLTENTFLSGVKVKKGEKDISLLKRIGAAGIVVISDFTVIFSKSSEAKTAILGQLRMVYDGEMTKHSGSSAEPITWKGYLGMLAGSTPSIYASFEEVADMGERFIYYRMKPYDVEKATRVSLERSLYGKQLDETISELYATYIKETIQHIPGEPPQLSAAVEERILTISLFAATLRTPTHYDRFTRMVDRVPVSEAPMRIALQLRAIARALSCMHYHDTGTTELPEEDIQYLEWCAYSLANEERRMCLKILADYDHDIYVSTSNIADRAGLDTSITRIQLQYLAAIGILERTGSSADGGSLNWHIKKKAHWEVIRRLERIEESSVYVSRETTSEEGFEDAEIDRVWNNAS